MILHHHERFDGQGYPHRLVGTAIPLEARIATIADVYDALTSDRPYRKGYGDREAKRIMEEEMVGYFDPELLSIYSCIPLEELVSRHDESASLSPPATGVMT